jgi:putative ABC transport system permease protein
MIGDYFKLALLSITHRKLRSWLTMLGIFVGIMAVVALLSLGEGLQATINSEFKKVGSNRLSIMPGGGGAEAAFFAAGGFSSSKLDETDVDVVRGVRGIEYVTAFSRKSVKVEFNNEMKYLSLWCIRTDEDSNKLFADFPFFKTEKGSMLKDGDVYKTAVGYGLTQDVFKKKVDLNNRISIEGISFPVSGLFKKAGNPEHDYKVALTEEACETLFNITEVTGITATVKEGFNNTQVAEAVKEKLRRHRNVNEGEEDFMVLVPQDIMRIFLSIIDMVQFVLTGIAAISLGVGALGIMNTMYTAVLERTREIGIMKAVGAKNHDIMMLFMIEAGLLGTVGGLIGTIMGLLLAKVVESLAQFAGLDLLRVYASGPLLAGAIVFSFLMGSASGVFPALRAASLRPVEALRK